MAYPLVSDVAGFGPSGFVFLRRQLAACPSGITFGFQPGLVGTAWAVLQILLLSAFTRCGLSPSVFSAVVVVTWWCRSVRTAGKPVSTALRCQG
jgi:hypothetical protein